MTTAMVITMSRGSITLECQRGRGDDDVMMLTFIHSKSGREESVHPIQ